MVDGACTSTTTSLNITVNSSPTSTFSSNGSSICLGTNSILTYSGNGSATATYTWNFAGGTAVPGTGQGPQTVSWTSSNTYNVSLQVIENGCSSTTVNTFLVNDIPTADFNANSLSVCAGNPVTLNYTGTASPGATYTWNFNGGTSVPGTGQGPQSVSWATQGTKTVTLSVTENNCTSTQETQTITVNSSPVVDFNFNPSSICEGQSVNIAFTGTASSNASYNWIFNGGSPQSTTGIGPQTITFSSGGTFTSKLIVTDNGCRDSLSKQFIVDAYPISSFSITPTTICAGDAVSFNFNGTAKPGAVYTWSFGSGQVISGSQNGPGPILVKYDNPGTENVSLMVDQNGCVSSPFSQTLTVNLSPTADFNAPVLSACDQLDVSFLNQSVGASQYLWDFGDNTSDNSANPTHHYSNGTYSIKLVVENPFGCKDSVTQVDYIKVEPTPLALFTSSPTVNTPVERLNAYFAFLNQSANASGYSWNFGDGQISNDVDPVHTYLDTGIYTVSLIAYNDLGCADTISLSPFIVVPTVTIFIPNAFTPNDNGINEKLKVYGSKLEQANLQIYDRWGEKVYDGDGLNDGWDGTFKGKKMDVGVYLYYVHITKSNGKELSLKGDISLLK